MMTDSSDAIDAAISGDLELGTSDGSLVVSRRPMTTIVMFSGGIDSAYTLVKLLKETTDELLVHHIHFVNAEGRHRIEADRAYRIVAFCEKTYRPFTYTESGLDHRAFTFFGFDMIGVGFEAGLVAHSYRNETGHMPVRWTIGSCAEEARNTTRWPHVLACMAANCFPEAPPAYFGLPIISKVDEIAYLPDDIVDMAWTCRRPVWSNGTAYECGRCKTCKVMAAVRRRKTEEDA